MEKTSAQKTGLAAAQQKPSVIVAGTDLALESDEVLHKAVMLAETFGAALHVVHVLDRDDRPSANDVVTARHQLDHAMKAGHTEAITAHPHIETGTPGRVVTTQANVLGADLVVLGFHRERAYADERIGSTMQTVMMQSEADILLVHRHSPAQYNTVLIAWDGKKPLAPMLARAKVYSPDARMSVFQNVTLNAEVADAQAALDAADGLDGVSEKIVRAGTVAGNLRDIIRERRIDLMVMPTRGDTGGDLSYLSHEILRHRLCDTLCCHRRIWA